MVEVTKTQQSAEEYAICVESRGYGCFRDKDTRNAVVRIIRGKGKTVKVSSIRNQQLHPEYVTDFVGTYFTGFGNTDYQTHWKVLYKIDLDSF